MSRLARATQLPFFAIYKPERIVLNLSLESSGLEEQPIKPMAKSGRLNRPDKWGDSHE